MEAAIGRDMVCNVTVECRNEREEARISERPLSFAALSEIFLCNMEGIHGFQTLSDVLDHDDFVRNSV